MNRCNSPFPKFLNNTESTSLNDQRLTRSASTGTAETAGLVRSGCNTLTAPKHKGLVGSQSENIFSHRPLQNTWFTLDGQNTQLENDKRRIQASKPSKLYLPAISQHTEKANSNQTSKNKEETHNYIDFKHRVQRRNSATLPGLGKRKCKPQHQRTHLRREFIGDVNQDFDEERIKSQQVVKWLTGQREAWTETEQGI